MDLASNPHSTVTCALSAFQVCSFRVQCPLQSVGGGGGVKYVAVHRVTGDSVALVKNVKWPIGRSEDIYGLCRPTNPL